VSRRQRIRPRDRSGAPTRQAPAGDA
jgi:hypothetical protein